MSGRDDGAAGLGHQENVVVGAVQPENAVLVEENQHPRQPQLEREQEQARAQQEQQNGRDPQVAPPAAAGAGMQQVQPDPLTLRQIETTQQMSSLSLLQEKCAFAEHVQAELRKAVLDAVPQFLFDKSTSAAPADFSPRDWRDWLSQVRRCMPVENVIIDLDNRRALEWKLSMEPKDLYGDTNLWFALALRLDPCPAETDRRFEDWWEYWNAPLFFTGLNRPPHINAAATAVKHLHKYANSFSSPRSVVLVGADWEDTRKTGTFLDLWGSIADWHDGSVVLCRGHGEDAEFEWVKNHVFQNENDCPSIYARALVEVADRETAIKWPKRHGFDVFYNPYGDNQRRGAKHRRAKVQKVFAETCIKLGIQIETETAADPSGPANPPAPSQTDIRTPNTAGLAEPPRPVVTDDTSIALFASQVQFDESQVLPAIADHQDPPGTEEMHRTRRRKTTRGNNNGHASSTMVAPGTTTIVQTDTELPRHASDTGGGHKERDAKKTRSKAKTNSRPGKSATENGPKRPGVIKKGP